LNIFGTQSSANLHGMFGLLKPDWRMKKNPPKYCFDDGILYSHEELTSLPYFLRFRTCKPNMPQRFAKLCVPNKTYSPIQWYHADQVVPFPIQITEFPA